MKHKIGCTRSIQTAVLVCAYLEKRYDYTDIRLTLLPTAVTADNGWWQCDIIATGKDVDKHSKELVIECRAFVAGRGEVWA